MKRTLATLVVLAMLVASPAYAAEQKKWNTCTQGFFGFIGCTIVGQITANCLLPWGDCNKRIASGACKRAKERALAQHRKWNADGYAGPPALPNCN